MNTTTAPAANILTPQEFIAQGTTAGAIMSIAAHPEQPRAVADALRAIARTVASITGQSLQIPGALTANRISARRGAANDNRRAGKKRAA